MAAQSSKNEMLMFGLHLISGDWPSDLSNVSCPKCKKKWLPNHQKTQMLIFGLSSTFDDQPSDPSNEMLKNCHQMKMK